MANGRGVLVVEQQYLNQKDAILFAIDVCMDLIYHLTTPSPPLGELISR